VDCLLVEMLHLMILQFVADMENVLDQILVSATQAGLEQLVNLRFALELLEMNLLFAPLAERVVLQIVAHVVTRSLAINVNFSFVVV